MKALERKHRVYGVVALIGLVALLGLAGSSDCGLVGGSAELFGKAGILFAVTLSAMALFRATGVRIARRKRAVMQALCASSEPKRRAA